MINLNKKNSQVCIFLPPSPSGPGMIKSPPMDVANLISLLNKENQFDVRLIDFRHHVINQDGFWEAKGVKLSIFENFNRCFDHLLKDEDPQIKTMTQKILIEEDFKRIDYLVFSISVCQQFALQYLVTALCLAKELKRIKPNMKIIMFGNCPKKHARYIMQHFLFVDAFLEDTNELSVVNYISTHNSKKPIDGISYRLNGQLIHSLSSSPINLDHCPVADYTLFDMKNYTHRGRIIMPYQLSEGCEKSCFFCYYIHRNSLVCRSVDKIISDLTEYSRQYQTNVFHFLDAAINFEDSYMIELCDAFRKKLPEIKWSALARPNMSYEILKMLKNSGCVQIRWGVESGSERMLKLINKDTYLNSIERTLKDAHNLGIYNFLTLITSLKNEIESDIEETKVFLRRNKKYIDSVMECIFGELGQFSLLELDESFSDESIQFEHKTKKYTEVLKECGIPDQDIIEMLTKQLAVTMIMGPSNDLIQKLDAGKNKAPMSNTIPSCIKRINAYFESHLVLQKSLEYIDINLMIQQKKELATYLVKLKNNKFGNHLTKLAHFISKLVSQSDYYVFYIDEKNANLSFIVTLAELIKKNRPLSKIVFISRKGLTNSSLKLIQSENLNVMLLYEAKDFLDMFTKNMYPKNLELILSSQNLNK